MSVLRASSLAAVTIFVWSTIPNPCSREVLRTSWRASTMSCSFLMGRTSLWVIVIRLPVFAVAFEQGHSSLHVESRVDALEAQAELDERDGHGRLHPHDHGARVEDARHPRNVGDHAYDEGIDHLERRDVDEHALRLE